MIDSHCHLDPSVWGDDAGVDAVLARARAAGVTRVVAIGAGYGFSTAESALAVARRHADVACTIGLHPHDAKELSDERLSDMVEAARDEKVLAIGEMGLDFHYDLSPRPIQREALRQQIQAARALHKPIVIHDRASEGETLRILDEEEAWEVGVLYHCYTGDAAAMVQIVERGGYVSIPGIVTFKNPGDVAEVAATAPLDRLLIETDSPFLTPVPHRGKKNEPAFVPLVAARVAALRGMRVEELSATTVANTLRFYRWS